MKSEALVNIKGVASILLKLYATDGSLALTQLLDIIPTYSRLLEIMYLLEDERMIIVCQGVKSNQRKVSLTPKGREYTKHIIAAEKLREN